MAKMPPLPAISNDPNHKRTFWETIIITTPVVLTVIATVLAGMSSSESSNAQYSRAAAAEMQSKASDQWGYFQAKKLRSDQGQNSVEMLRTLAEPATFDPSSVNSLILKLLADLGPGSGGSLGEVESALSRLSAATTRPDAEDEMARFCAATMPSIVEGAITDPNIVAAMVAVGTRASEADLEQQAGGISQENLDQAIEVANQNVAAFGDAVDQANKNRAELLKLWQDARQGLSDYLATTDVSAVHNLAGRLNSTFTVADLNWNSQRYQKEAQYNQTLGELYEIQVRRDGFVSDRHRLRSKQFFYGMLGAQAGVTIATFSLAVRKRNLLWGLAASAGLAAITFAAYVYVFV
jgi:hypothetical protein